MNISANAISILFQITPKTVIMPKTVIVVLGEYFPRAAIAT